jgi:hypothetical protein
MYKIYAIIGLVIVLIFSYFFNHETNTTTVRFTITYYNYRYLGVFYALGLVFIIYIIVKIFNVLIRKAQFFSLLIGNSYEHQRKELLELFVRRHITFLVMFILCYLPNNLIQIIQTFLSYKLCITCEGYSVFVFLMSTSCAISFAIKMTEPYMIKYFKLVLHFVTRKQENPESGVKIN